MPEPIRWTEDELIALAISAAHKVDLMGERGATLCSQDEIIAMAAVVKHTIAVPRILRDAGIEHPVQHPVEPPSKPRTDP